MGTLHTEEIEIAGKKAQGLVIALPEAPMVLAVGAKG